MNVLIEDEKPDIVLITETWLDASFGNCSLNMQNFDMFCQDRNNGADPTEGVMICTHKKIAAKRIEIDTTCEIVTVSIHFQNTSVKLGVLYRPLSTNANESANLFNLLRDILETTRLYAIFGDYNLPGIDWTDNTTSNATAKYFIDICNEVNAH